jgi:hypothetical protein
VCLAPRIARALPSLVLEVHVGRRRVTAHERFAMTLVQQFLRSGGTLAELETLYRLRIARHAEYPSLVGLCYNLVASPLAEPLVRECRGVVLDEAAGWNVVARGFDRFCAVGDPLADDVDWTVARVFEKLDGTFVLAYWHGQHWNVATMRRPDALGRPDGCERTFRELFWEALGRRDFPEAARAYTLLFELTTPDNVVIVEQRQRCATLVGARLVASGLEVHADVAAVVAEVASVREFPRRTVQELEASFEGLSPRDFEGYVVVDAAFRRVKVKHPGYVRLHRLKFSMSEKQLLDAVRRGEGPQVAATLPELADRVRNVEARLDGIAAAIECELAALGGVGTSREFAVRALGTRFQRALMLLRSGGARTGREALAKLPLRLVAGLVTGH